MLAEPGLAALIPECARRVTQAAGRTLRKRTSLAESAGRRPGTAKRQHLSVDT
jgi:hypothetical protein